MPSMLPTSSLEESPHLHGLPNIIVSDGDIGFTSHFWRTLRKKFGRRLQFFTVYHPQTDNGEENSNSLVLEIVMVTTLAPGVMGSCPCDCRFYHYAKYVMFKLQ